MLVASNRADAGALSRARASGVPTAVIANPADGAALAQLLESHRVECVALAGYLKLVPREVTDRWRRRIVNIHPALLPKFGGAGMYGRRVHEAVIAAGETAKAAPPCTRWTTRTTAARSSRRSGCLSSPATRRTRSPPECCRPNTGFTRATLHALALHLTTSR